MQLQVGFAEARALHSSGVAGKTCEPLAAQTTETLVAALLPDPDLTEATSAAAASSLACQLSIRVRMSPLKTSAR